MKEGLLWFDDDPARSLTDKVGRATKRYRQKYGRAPDVCYVHPKMMGGAEAQLGDVRVLPACTVQPNHFWLGVLDTRRSKSGEGGA